MTTLSIKSQLGRQFYVWEYTKRRKWLLIGAIILFSLLFKFVYFPEYFQTPIPPKMGFYISHMLVNIGVLIFMFFGLPQMFGGYFKEDNRTVIREIYWMFILFTLLTVLHALLIITENSVTPFSKGLRESLFINLAVGIFPVAFMVILSYIRRLEMRLKELELYSARHLDRSHSGHMIQIPAGQGAKALRLTLADLLYIKSANNYSEVHYKHGDKIKRVILRTPLSEIEQHLNSEYIFRVHRSYIVNFLGISGVVGNANKCSVKMRDLDIKVPVSRSRRTELLIKLRNLPLRIVA